MNVFLLDTDEHNFSEDDLPLLIHGQDGNGASHFSVSVIANFYHQGAKILFTSGFKGARDAFKEQVGENDDAILVENAADVLDAHSKRIIMVPIERYELFKQLLKELPDINERIIYFKNYNLFDQSVFEEVRKHNKCVLQGDLNKVANIAAYKDTPWVTKIYFTQPPIQFDSKIPELPKYSGFFRQGARGGIVSLRV